MTGSRLEPLMGQSLTIATMQLAAHTVTQKAIELSTNGKPDIIYSLCAAELLAEVERRKCHP